MIELVLKTLGAGLSLWVSKEKRKYQDKYIALKQEYYEEVNKQRPDHARLDVIEFELRLLSESFCSKVGNENASHPSN